jgi:asparagine synthase (glutamine-hydrolysing)
VVFDGYLDNATELAAELGLAAPCSREDVYAAALDRWGDDADVHCIGVYATIALAADARSLRLARSPYEAPPLYYHGNAGWAMAGSVPRVFFAAGVPRELDRSYLIRSLLYQVRESGANWYRGIDRVGVGETVTLDAQGARTRLYYDPETFTRQALRPADVPEQAWDLLKQGADHVASTFANPGMLLSGGLDSPLTAVALLEVLPPERDLLAFTFVPCPEWDGLLRPDLMGDERPLVEALAAMHPRIKVSFDDNAGRGVDYGWRDVFAASDVATPGMPNSYAFHAVWEAARSSGCDGVVSAEYGNLTYSTPARWACAEYLRRGRWGQLRRSLAAAPGDERTWPRRFMARAVMPHLPLAVRRLTRRLRGQVLSPVIGKGPLNPALRNSPENFAEDGTRLDPFTGFVPRDHGEFANTALRDGTDYAADVHQAFEQIHGIRRRDATAYRPLIEFCLTLATEEFEYHGIDRYLARRMAAGRLPDAVRLNARYGRHGVDWHARIGAQRPELLARLRALRDFPEAAELIDLDAAIRALENWPERTTYDPEVWAGILGTATRALLMGGFLNYVHGRNDI